MRVDQSVPLEPITRALHEAYLAHRVAGQESAETNPSLQPWEQLPEHLKDSNRVAARQIWGRLEALGYAIVPADAPGDPVTFADLEPSAGLMARLGHIRWVNERLAAGWAYAPGPKDLVRRTHPSLVPWDELPEEERVKDREQLRDLFPILERFGLKVVRHHGVELRDLLEDLALEEADPRVGQPETSAEPTAPAGAETPKLTPQELQEARAAAMAHLSADQVEALARGLHEGYVARRMAGRVSVLQNPALRPWERLPEHLRDSNRQTIRELVQRLDLLGFQVAPAPWPGEPVSRGELEQHGETLAEMGHLAWRNHRLAAGWSSTDGTKDLLAKQHPSLVPWEELPEMEREKEREIVRELPALLEAAGLKLRRRIPEGPLEEPE